MTLEALAEKVLAGGTISKAEALWLYAQPLPALTAQADRIRAHFCGDRFDLCTIANGKSGKCPEDCRFCAQSARHHTGIAEYPLLSAGELLAQAKRAESQGIPRFSIVTSGRRLSAGDVERMREAVRLLRRETKLSVCVSFGLLDEGDFRKLKEAGVSRVHCNLESSRRFFPQICTTHSFDEKLAAIRAAQRAGLEVCSGGILGLGETVEDRMDMALTLRELGVKSVPVNLLNPIPGTPLAENKPLTAEELNRALAVYRFLLPDADLRFAGGRGLLADKGAASFRSGANAAITGDMLTTAGITAETDLAMLKGLGYRAAKL